jgi:tRNA pseudouridine38-40 synthase
MVRAIVGTLVDVGLKKIQAHEMTAILAAKNRSAASLSVPAHGLFLWRVDYEG